MELNMTVLDHSPRATYSFRLQRRHEIVIIGGMDAVLHVGDALRHLGFPIREFAADVREGVPYSRVTCTVSLTSEESDAFPAMLCALDDVVSVEPY
jgi:hypothetical protein